MLGKTIVTYTPSGGKASQYVDGTDLFCNTKQIDVIATAVGVPLKLITGEITPNAPYSGPLKGTVIYGYTDEGNETFSFRTLEEAQAKCSTNAKCVGVEFESNNKRYTTRKGGAMPLEISKAGNKEFAFAKIGKPVSADLLPWKINIVNADWTISK